jgi:hypothetical protein
MADMAFVADATVQSLLASFGGLGPDAPSPAAAAAAAAVPRASISRRESGAVAKTWVVVRACRFLCIGYYLYYMSTGLPTVSHLARVTEFIGLAV